MNRKTTASLVGFLAILSACTSATTEDEASTENALIAPRLPPRLEEPTSPPNLREVRSSPWVQLKPGDHPAKGIQGGIGGSVWPDSPKRFKTTLFLNNLGLPTDQTFTAHVHTQPCEDGMGGDRYENVLPVPASNVGFLNADAPFVWVDFTPQVGALGESIPVIFRTYPLDAARAKSMVITLKDSTQKLACTNLSF